MCALPGCSACLRDSLLCIDISTLQRGSPAVLPSPLLLCTPGSVSVSTQLGCAAVLLSQHSSAALHCLHWCSHR